MVLEPLQGWGLHHNPGKPGPMPDPSPNKDIFPNIHSKLGGHQEQLEVPHPSLLSPQAAGTGLHRDALRRGRAARDGDPQPHGGCRVTGVAHFRFSGCPRRLG